MDFAAQLAKLERNASKARTDNNNNNNNNNQTNSSSNNDNDNNNINNDRRRQRPNFEYNNNNLNRNTRPRNSSSYSPSRRQPYSQQQQQQYQGNHQANQYNSNPRGGRGGSYNNSTDNQFQRQPHQQNQNQQDQQQRYDKTNSNRSTNSSSTNSSNGVIDGRSLEQQYRSHNYNNNNNNPRSQYRSHQNNGRPPPLETMVRYGYNVAPYPSDFVLPAVDDDYYSQTELTGSKKVRSIPHLCLLAITIDDLPYEHIWKHWATSSNNNDACCYVSLICHAKYPNKVTSEWLKRRILVQKPVRGRGKNTLSDPIYHTRCPEWGKPEITRAMIDLVDEGLKIKGYKSINDTKVSNSLAIEYTISELAEIDPRYTMKRYLIGQPSKISNKTSEKTNIVDIHDSIEDGEDTSDGIPNSSVGKEPAKSVVEEIEGGNESFDWIPPVDKFLFISETCIPITTLKECCQLLFPSITKDTKRPEEEETSTLNPTTAVVATANANDLTTFETNVSWLNAFNRNNPGTPKNKYESDQFAEINRLIPGQYRWKADQWMVLSRIHANAIIKIDDGIRHDRKLWTSFSKINASDEMYFPTTMALLGILREEKQIKNQTVAVTVTNKEGGDLDMSNDTNKDDDKEKEAVTDKVPSPSDAGEMGDDSKSVITKPPISILRRPVTYTDWSEGMRNPALYTGGVRDLKKVARKAREQGSIMARKFALWPLSATPSNQKNDNDNANAPGNISIEQWQQCMDELINEAKLPEK